MEKKVKVKFCLSAEEKSRLVENAKEAGMSMAAYIRKQIRDSEVIIHEVQINDMSGLIAMIREANAEMDSYVSVMQSAGQVFPQQLDKIIVILKRLEENMPEFKYDRMDRMVKKELKKMRNAQSEKRLSKHD